MNNINIESFTDYKEFINEWISSLPKKGRGEFQKIALALNVHSSLISQIFKGDKNLSEDQAWLLGNYLKLNQEELNYFLLLIRYEIAANHQLKKYLNNLISSSQKELKQLKSKVKHKKLELTEEQKAIFYSQWYYSAIRICTFIDHLNNTKSIADYLNLPLQLVEGALEFLIQTNLVIADKGVLKKGPTLTHISHTSPLANLYHTHLKLRAIERQNYRTQDDLFISAFTAINKKDAKKIEEILRKSVESCVTIMQESEPTEEVYIINIDWFPLMPS
jgi:uncharacterized protein (TIGR02147 family)